MTHRPITLLATLALTLIPAVEAGAKGELMFGCWTRPACGKVCKLVCETTTLTSICYGAECEQICVPGRSQPGCKHCSACCGDCEPGLACPPKCEFCWRDWCPVGCGQPRTVKKLAKYEAEKEICWYHWEVVDGGCCDCGAECGDGGCEPSCRCVYKAAPANAQIGDTFELTGGERVQLASATISTANDGPETQQAAVPSADDADQSMWQKIGGLFLRQR